VREQGPFPEASGSVRHGTAHSLGVPLCIEEAAELIGCSPWTVRQTLIPRGLPHFRFKANGRLIFYRDQVIRWIENQQQGGNTTS
jgi:excisionase family DNA binding protein